MFYNCVWMLAIERMKVLSLIIITLFCSCQSKNKNVVPVEETKEDKIDSLWLPMDSVLVDKNDVFTCVSEDGTMKFYSWNTGLGGTCPNYSVSCQFYTKDGQLATEDLCVKESEPAWVSAVHSIKKNDGSTYYITTRSHRASSNDGYRWMDAFMIDHDTLKNVSVLDGGDDLDECMLEINYRISDWFYATNGEGWEWLFEYDAYTKNLYVPITVYIEEDVPVISDRYRLYHFDGMEFVYKGEVPHKGLHSSLHNYIRLVKYFRTKNYIVRVDKLQNGTYRYASWKASSNMSEKPELIIVNGKYDDKKDCYIFANEDIDYKVGYSEDKPIEEGVFEHHEFLLVQKKGKILLKEERMTNTD